jgi:hypothetical protein
MMANVYRMCLLSLFLLMGTSTWAQNDPDQILLGVPLKLGMTQEHVLAEVGKHYGVKPLSDASQFVVFTLPNDSTDKPKWEGMLAFKNGKLASIERLWAYENDDNSVALTKSLVGVLTDFVKGGKSTCVVQTLLSDSLDAQGETVFLTCGKRTLKISVAKVQGYKEDASVSESLE